jgi:hypothetical protein
MSNYVKATDFSVKDGLLPGNPAKIVKGTEIDDEFDAISAAIQTKADLASPTFTGSPAAPTASPGTNTTQLATTAFAAAAATAAANAAIAAANLSTMATQSSSNVSITGGSITGITDITVADGGTGASSFTANSVLLGNGTSSFLTVAPSTSGNVLTSNGTTWTSASIPVNGVGVSQTWQDVTSSRSLGTTYTNSTSLPIMVLINTTNNSLSAVIGGVNLGVIAANQSGGGGGQNVSLIVPAGATYVFTSTGSLSKWVELR